MTENVLEQGRSRISGRLAVRAGLAASLMSVPFTGHVLAQQASDDNIAEQALEGTDDTLETVVVSGEVGQTNTNAAAVSSSRLPGSVRDVPQTVNVIPEKILTQQNVTTLEQALKNVPGITVAVGEGRGGMQGDRFRIRGFETLGDTYRDGLRDFGAYVRDSFNMEQVEVFKGPNGENFGVGTTGGAINTGSKRARLGTSGSADVSYGTGPLFRTSLDYNWQFDDTKAVRFNLMGHWQDVADRDFVDSDRWGAAVSLGLGLGTDQTLYIDYMYQHNKRTADYGVPFLTPVGKVGRPAPEFGVPRDNYYGKSDDIDDSDVHMLTVSYKNELNDVFTLHNDTRYLHYERFFAATPPSCNAACSALYFAGGNPTLGFTSGGSGIVAYDQSSWGLQNITTGVAKFELGGLRNEAIFGLDMYIQDDFRNGYTSATAKTRPTLLNPIRDRANYVKVLGDTDDSHSYNIALFASDRLWFNEQWSVMAGLRWEHQSTHYQGGSVAGTGVANANLALKNHWLNPKASLIWEPTKNQSYYLSWSVTHNVPGGQNVASEIFSRTAGFGSWDPEKSELFELGTKLDFFDGDLGITAAIFQVERKNSYDSDDLTGNLTYSGDARRIRGFEAGVTGQVTSQWSVYGSYTYLESEILSSNTRAHIGKSVDGVAKNAASLWTTYDLAPHFDGLEGQLLIGGGATYRDAIKTNAAGTTFLPHSLSIDALVSYETEKWDISLNAYNLANRINYDAYFGSRSIPASGRTFTLKLGTKF